MEEKQKTYSKYMFRDKKTVFIKNKYIVKVDIFMVIIIAIIYFLLTGCATDEFYEIGKSVYTVNKKIVSKNKDKIGKKNFEKLKKVDSVLKKYDNIRSFKKKVQN